MLPFAWLSLIVSLTVSIGPSGAQIPADPVVEIRRAEKCFGENDLAATIEHSTRVIEALSASTEASTGLAGSNARDGRSWLSEALALRAAARCARSEFAEALRDLDRAATLDGVRPELFISRAICRASLRDISGAMDDLHEAARRNPDLTEACRLGRATLLAASRRHLEAIKVLEESGGSRGRDRAADAFRAALKVDLRDLDGALDDIEQTLRTDPRDAGCLTVRAMALLALDRVEDGRKSSAEAIAVDPGLAIAHNTHAACLMRLGKLDEAQAELDRAIELEPGSMSNYPARASVRAARGDEKGALEDLSMADRFASNSADSDRKRAAIFAISADPKIRDVEKARILADRAVSRTGNNPDSQAALSTVLAVQGDYAGALRAAQVALDNNERVSLVVWAFQLTPDRIRVEFTMRFRDERRFDEKLRQEIKRYRLLTSKLPVDVNFPRDSLLDPAALPNHHDLIPSPRLLAP